MELYVVVWGFGYEGASTCGIYSTYTMAYDYASAFVKGRDEFLEKWIFEEDSWRRGSEYVSISQYQIDQPLKVIE